MSLLKDKGPAKEWFEQYPFDRWQRLRRHPDYRSFCRKYEEQFEKIGHVSIMFSMVSDDTGDDAPLLKIKEQFNLSKVYHYDCDFSSSDLLHIPEIFKDYCAVNPQCSFERIDSKTTMLSLVKDGHYIDCKINIAPDIPLEEILDGVASFVKQARSETAQKNKRSQFDSNMVGYQVYDLRVDRVPFKDISKELGIDAANARKKFSRAWELIHGGKYKTKEIFALIQQKLAEQGRWSELQRIDPYRREKLADAGKDGRQLINDNYHVEEESPEDKTVYRERIRELKAYCQKCPDTTCSGEMTAAFNCLLRGTSNLSQTSPCPKLRDKILQ